MEKAKSTKTAPKGKAEAAAKTASNEAERHKTGEKPDKAAAKKK